jgi:low temperature requirement protein LtrA
MTNSNGNLLRVRDEHSHSRVTYAELFFDLVFVFAITQLSHTLLEHLSLVGLAQATLLFMAVWWVWIFTSWVTNWLDPDETPVRLLLFALMLAGLVLSTSIPQAFTTKAIPFACAYVFMQLGRTLFMLWALKGNNAANFRNFQRILAWLALSSMFWIAGAFASSEARFALWVVAILVEYFSPLVRFWTPGLGASPAAVWDVEGGHFAERCALFVIIALGESVLVTGATFAKLPGSPVAVASFLVAFTGSVAMWWIYFNIGAERGTRHLSKSDSPGRLGRLYNYLHLPLVGGIILAAVGDELVLAHPTGHTDMKTAAVLLGAPALYLIGNLAFKRISAVRLALSHLVGMALLAALVPFATTLSPLALSAATTAVLVLVAIWETLSFRLGPGRTPRDLLHRNAT